MINVKWLKILGVVVLIIGAGCDVNDKTKNTPKELNTATIKGVAEYTQGATVKVFDFTSGTKGRIYADAVTDSTGNFSVTSKTFSRPLLFEAGPGSLYDVDGNYKPFERYNFRALVNYKYGAETPVTVSALTTIAAGLAEYYMGAGLAVEAAIEKANTQISSDLDFDIHGVVPVNVFSEGTLPSITAGYKYGITTAALLMAAAAKKIPLNEYAGYQYDDIRADGVLNDKIRLGFTLTGEKIAQLVLAAGQSPLVLTKVDLDALAVYAAKVSKAVNAVFISAGTRSSLAGTAFDGLIINGDIKIYSYIAGVKGAELASTMTGTDGQYSVTLDAAAIPVVIEITKGFYIEEASGLKISLKADPSDVTKNQFLRALIVHQPGQAITVNLTTWTTIAAGLAENKIKNGTATDSAVNLANQEISNYLGFDILTTTPVDVLTAKITGTTISPAAAYGFLAAGVSQMTYELGKVVDANNPHNTINSINFTRMAYEDMAADGVLDGKGKDGAQLMLGNYIISSDTYTNEIPKKIAAFANSAHNNTGVIAATLFDFVSTLNKNNLLFGTNTISVINTDPVLVSISKSPGSLINGTAPINVELEDLFGVQRVDAKFGNTSLGNYSTGSVDLQLGTQQVSDGNHDLVLDVTNTLGKSKTFTFTYSVDNKRYIYTNKTILPDQLVVYEYDVNDGTSKSFLTVPNPIGYIMNDLKVSPTQQHLVTEHKSFNSSGSYAISYIFYKILPTGVLQKTFNGALYHGRPGGFFFTPDGKYLINRYGAKVVGGTAYPETINWDVYKINIDGTLSFFKKSTTFGSNDGVVLKMIDDKIFYDDFFVPIDPSINYKFKHEYIELQMNADGTITELSKNTVPPASYDAEHNTICGALSFCYRPMSPAISNSTISYWVEKYDVGSNIYAEVPNSRRQVNGLNRAAAIFDETHDYMILSIENRTTYAEEVRLIKLNNHNPVSETTVLKNNSTSTYLNQYVRGVSNANPR